MKRLQLWNRNWCLSQLIDWKNSDRLLLNPEYQRGDVWGWHRRVNLIRSLMIGLPIGAVIMNDRLSSEWPEWHTEKHKMAVVDGRQRITTLLMFMTDRLWVPREFFEPLHVASRDIAVVYSGLTDVGRRKFEHLPLHCIESNVATLEEEQEIYDLVNYGGVPQGHRDVDCPEEL